MGLRLRKSVKIMPGLKINLSKSGASLTVGKAGACVNISSKGTRATVGMPGTGISYSTRLSGDKTSRAKSVAIDAERDSAEFVSLQPRKKVSFWGKFGIWFCWAALLPITQKGDAYGAFSLAASIVLTVVTVKWINKRRSLKTMYCSYK